jgi:hypothetical protein
LQPSRGPCRSVCASTSASRGPGARPQKSPRRTPDLPQYAPVAGDLSQQPTRAQSERALDGTVVGNQALRSIPAPPGEPLHQPTLPFHFVPPSQIAEDRLPRRRERVSFRQVPSAGRPRIRALRKLPPSRRPQIQPLPLRASRWPYACPPATRRRPPSHPTVRSQSGRSRVPTRLGPFRCATLWANRLCRAQTPIAPQPTCQRLAAIFTSDIYHLI